VTASASAATVSDHVAEAAARFGLPAAWLWQVIDAESAGDPRAVSRAGAIGLMQVMPATYAELRGRYGLGPDPFDPRDNVLAGAAYLRELYHRYGAPAFLAAYNAGPGRLDAHLKDGRPLPAETRRYLARLAPSVGGPAPTLPDAAPPPSLFAMRTALATDTDPPVVAGGDGLFVALRRADEASDVQPD
jgi:soluble lytic murein transglycosylase-like protein